MATCPANIGVSNDPGQCSAVVTYTVGGTDNCGAATTVVPASGSVFNTGTTTVTATAADPTGNTATCSFTVTVNDNEAPAITCPADITVTHDPNSCGSTVSYPALTASDNCGAATVSLLSGLASGSQFPIGTTTVVWVATDGGGNTATCSFNVNVSGVTVQPSDFVTVGDANNTGGNCFQVTPALNNRFGAIWYQNLMTLTSDFSLEFDLGFGTLDQNGADGLAFVLQPVSTGQGSNGGGIGYMGISPSVDVEFDTWQNSQNADPAADHVGINVNGNTSHATGALSAPVAVPNLEDGQQHHARITWDASATRMEVWLDGVLRNSLVQDIANTVFNGSPDVYWGWTGATGGSVNDQRVCVGDVSFSESFLVSSSSSTPESCPGASDGSIDVSVVGGVPPYTYLWSNGATTQDLAGVPGGVYCVTVTDQCGNTAATCDTVGSTPDNTPPSITCPASIVTGNDPGQCGAVVSYNVAAGDNCQLASLVMSPASPATLPVGTTTVSATATDASGNTATCSFSVTVNDTEAPVVSCPANITVAAPTGQCYVPVSYNATSADNCQSSLVVSPASGGNFTVGTTTVTATAADPSGNTASCSFTVTVTGVQGGITWTGIPADVTIACTAPVPAAPAIVPCGGGSGPVNPGDFRTQTQGGWGANCNGNNPGCYRDAHFASAFPSGVVIGCQASSRTVTFTSSAAVNTYLPCGGTPSVLAQSYTNPGCLSNVLSSQLLSAVLSVGFDNADANFGSSNVPLQSLVMASGPLAGLTVAQVIAEGNKALGGCASPYSLTDLNQALRDINESFDNGTTVGSALVLPGNSNNGGGVSATSGCGPCPVVTMTQATVAGPCAGTYDIIRTWTAR
ncbi:MAG: HYR domain-containing protein, partial [Bacteroidia bacterium]